MATTKKTAPKKKEPAAGKTSPVVAKNDANDDMTISISGPAHPVRRALTAMRFDENDWNPAVTRQIAIDKTFTEGATAFDRLAGPKVGLIAQSDRDLYRDRCIAEAEARGHSVADEFKIPAKENTTLG